MVEHGDLLGQPHRVVPGDHHHLGAQAHALGAAGEVGQVEQGIGADRIVREVVLGDPDGVEAEFIGQLQLGELLLQELTVVDLGMIGEPGGEAHMHDAAPYVLVF